MLQFIQQSGPFILVQGALTLVVILLALVNSVRLARASAVDAPRLGTSIDAVLFWGALVAVLGFLGQWSGLFKGASALLDHGAVNPNMVVLGVGESLGTSVFGMFVLIAAGIFWGLLRLGLRRRSGSHA